MSDDATQMAACGACQAIIPLDSKVCPECNARLAGEEQRWECGACGELFDHQPRSCTACGVVFVSDDVVDVLRTWMKENNMSAKDIFGRFDTNEDNVIDAQELRDGLLALNLAALPPSEVDRLVDTIDENGDGSVDLGELQAILSDATMQYSESVLERVMNKHGIDDVEAFVQYARSFDENENRYLDQKELTKAAEAFVSQPEPEAEEEPAEDTEDPEAPLTDDEDEEHESAEDEEQQEEAADDDFEEAADDEAPDDAVDEIIDAEDDDVEEDLDESDDVEEEDDALEEDIGVETEALVDHDDPFGALLDALDDLDVTQMFHEVDTDGSQNITHEELSEAIATFTGVSFTELDIVAIVQHLDADNDGTIDMVEFVRAIEQHDGLVEPVVAPAKTFPSPMQKSMMSKRWNDVVWPLIHASFALLLVLVLVNGLIGPVNGEGGKVALEMTEAHTDAFGESYYDGNTGETYFKGEIYACEPSVQEGKCRNSLTPFAGTSDGEGGIKSMPKGFYADAYAFLGLSIIGLLVSLTMHYVIVPGWRTRVKTMKQLEQDHEDVSSDLAEEQEDDAEADEESDEEEYDDEEYDDDEYDDDEYDDEEYDDEEYDEDAIDVGDEAGVVIDGEEYYGTIISFDDEEGTVTIEDDESGEQVTGDQDSMFLE
ncbi:MAG: EF-hand domain-containing protein [Candidatus Thermoplasmatota archaeon]|nr:EF-hand domain-containing protein [Candidatus Thermoplasmatota archaeon]